MYNAILKKETCGVRSMAKPKKSEKLLLEKIANSAQDLLQQQRGLEIGQLIAIIRGQLSMSQRALARRAKIPQSTISKIESGHLQPNVTTLQKILNSMECDLLITAVPRESPETTRRNQAMAKARRVIQYLQGTMSLEKQEPNQELLKELIEEKVKDLLGSSGAKLWEEEL